SNAWAPAPSPEQAAVAEWHASGPHSAATDAQESIMSQQSVPLWNPTTYTDWAASTSGSLEARPDLPGNPTPVGVPANSSSSPHNASMPSDTGFTDEEGDTLEGRRRPGK